MPKKEQEAEKGFDQVFDVMPGADKDTEVVESVDMNFGLGDEPVAEVEEVEDDAPETQTLDEEQVETPQAVEDDADDDADDADDADDTVAEADPEPEPEPEPAKKDHMVPKSRLDEVLAKQKALQKQLDDMKKAQQPAEDAPAAYDFSVKEVEYQNLLLDGESEKAAALRQEIRAAERTQMEYELTQKVTQTVAQNQQATALQQAASELEANFPVFDQNSAEYNAEYTQETIELRDAFIMQGYDAVDALSKAAKFVVKSYDLDSSPALATGTLDGTAAPKAQSVDEVAKKRAEVGKKLKAAKAQPPELPGESSAARGEKGLDLLNMTESEFNALPEGTLRRLRGDIL